MNAVAAAIVEQERQYEYLAKIAEAAKVNVPGLPSFKIGIPFASAADMSRIKLPDNYLDAISSSQDASRDLSAIAGATKMDDFFQPDMGLTAVQAFSAPADANSVEGNVDGKGLHG